MATKLYDLAVKTGEYTGNDGNTKGRWQNVGSVMQGDDGGQFVMLARWFNPAGVPDLRGKGGDSLLISCFEPNRDRQGGGQRSAPQQTASQPTTGGNDFDDDIPFSRAPHEAGG